MANITPTTVPTKRLASSITGSSLSMQLNNILGWDGVALTSADFGTKAYGVFRDSENKLLELFEWDPSTIADASITIVKRGLKFTGDLATEVSGNKRTWIRNDTLVELGADVPHLLAHMVSIIGSPLIIDQLTYSTELVPSDRKDLVTKGYVDDMVNGGEVSINQVVVAGLAGENVAQNELVYFNQTDDEWKLVDADDPVGKVWNLKLGIAMGAGTNGNSIANGVLVSGILTGLSGLTAGESYYASNTPGAWSTTPGTTRRKIGVAKSTTELYFDPEIEKMTYDEVRRSRGSYANDTAGSDAYVVTLSPAATEYSAGMRVIFKALTLNNGAATLNVNGLGAKSIVKGGSTALATGDIASGQVVEVVYDGTNFQMMSRPGETGNVQTFNSSGTWTKPGRGTVAIIECWGGGGSGASSNNHGATGGGGGVYVMRMMQLSDLGATETVTIGDGGEAATNNNIGNFGGNTTFGAHVTAYGGGRGYIVSNDANDYSFSGGGGGTAFAQGATGHHTGMTSVDPTPEMQVYGPRVVGGTGGSGLYSGAGGGGTSGTAAGGGNSVYGGAGGGASHNGGTEGGGGTSLYGGSGGAGKDATTGVTGSVPGGGGGACSSGSHSSGAGGKGQCKVTVY